VCESACCLRCGRSDSNLLLQLQQLQQHSAGLAAARTPLLSGDVLVQLQVQLPLAGTWHVTAGLESSTLMHVGDVVAANSRAKEYCQIPTDSCSASGGQRRRLQLPEAFETDDDEPLSASDAASSASEARVPECPSHVEAEYVLCVRGAAFVVENGESSSSTLSYVHSGSCVHCAAYFVSSAAAHWPSTSAAAPMSVAVLKPQLAPHAHLPAPLQRRTRAGGGSWMVSVTHAPLALLPERDIAAEAAESFPSLIGPDGLARAEHGSGNFTGLLIGCCVISIRDACAFASPWPLHKNSSE
jgi:hypothetical protein